MTPHAHTCDRCNSSFTLMYSDADAIRWREGALIQDAMPYLSDAERELPISRTCGQCFDQMFASDDDTSEVCGNE